MLSCREYIKNNFYGESTKRSAKLYKMYVETETKIQDMEVTQMIVDDIDWLGDCVKQPTPPMPTKNLPFNKRFVASNEAYKKACKKEEKETTMTEKSEAEILRSYLFSRLDNTYYDARNDLTEMFNIYKTAGPRTYKELIDWITTGKYTLDPQVTAKVDSRGPEDDRRTPFQGITWNVPNQPDAAGFTKAELELDKQRTLVKDVIMTNPSKAIDAILALLDWKPSNAPAATAA